MENIEFVADYVRDAQTDHTFYGHAYARKYGKQKVFSLIWFQNDFHKKISINPHAVGIFKFKK